MIEIKPHRKMKDAKFQKHQWECRYNSHTAPVNQLVDMLKLKHLGRIPYVDPLYGGIHAKVLFLFQDPGSKTDDRNGSGFLSAENDDPSAQLFAQCLDEAKLNFNQVITWNAYPWSLPEGKNQPTAKQLEIGIEPLYKLLKMLKKLKVIITMGCVATSSWERFNRHYPNIAAKYLILSGLHTSTKGITNGMRHTKKEGIRKNLNSMKKALNYLRK